jgi:2'-hydroxyisoflavone reductase
VRLLVLGGTAFLGRAVVEHALTRGDEVTLVNRGRTNPGLFPEAERVRADLTSGAEWTRGRGWDAAIDLDPTTQPSAVARYAGALADAVGHVAFVSTISVYADPSQPIDEEAAVHAPPDPEPATFIESEYGALKVGCERAVHVAFGSARPPSGRA